MDWIIYSLALLISFSGIIIGVLLSNIAIEEITQVSKYLRYWNALLIMAITFAAISKLSTIYATIAAIIIVILFLTFKDKDTWFYGGSGIFFGIAAIYNTLAMVSVLTFAYGLSITTLIVSEKIKVKSTNIPLSKSLALTKILILKNSVFLITGLLSYAILGTIV